MGSVVQPWLANLPWKEQSAYFSALRGPDHAHCHNVKLVVKLLRVASQQDADPATSYMRLEPVHSGHLEHELEYCTLHFVAHLLQALATLAKHGPAEYAEVAHHYQAWFTATYHLVYVHG